MTQPSCSGVAAATAYGAGRAAAGAVGAAATGATGLAAAGCVAGRPATGFGATTAGAVAASSAESSSPSSIWPAAEREGGAGMATAGIGEAGEFDRRGGGRGGLGDHRRGAAAVRRLREVVADQPFHIGVARPGGAAAEHDRDQRAAVAMHRGQKVEAGSAGVAGLDAVDAVDAAEQVIVIADDLAAVGELVGRVVLEVARKALLGGAGENGEVARGGDLFVVGEAGGVAVDGARHAERVRLARHHVGEMRLVAADRFGDRHGDVVGRARHDRLDRVLDSDGVARLSRASTAPARRRARRSGSPSAESSRLYRAVRTGSRAS